jgi:3-dehydroquinate synthase
MICEAKLSNMKIGLSDTDLAEITEVISGLYPRYNISESSYKDLYGIMQKDKKNQSGKINCTLLTSIGQCRIDNICTEDELYAGLKYYSTLNNVFS